MRGNIYCRNFPKTMHVLQSRIGLKECFVRPSFLNFPIPNDTDNALITTQMIVKAAKYMHITKCMHIFCMELLLSTFQWKNIRVRGPFGCLYYTYHRLSPRKEPLFVGGRMGREKKERPGGGGGRGDSHMLLYERGSDTRRKF